MAATLSPEIVIDSVTNAVISWDGKLVSQGIIYWHIPAVAATELTANYKNYVSSWNPNYGWDSFENGKSTFDGSSNTCHISAMVTGYKYTITTSSNISEYNNVVYDTREKAEAEVVKIKNTLVNGNYGYTVIVQGSGVTYEIYKVDLIRVPEEGGPQNIGQCNATKDFDVLNYITVQEKPELPDFNCSVTASTNSASAYVSGIKPSDKVSFTINGTTKYINASNGGDALITIDGLAEGTAYTWSVSVEGYKGPKTDTVVTLTTPKWTLSSYTATSVTVQFSGVSSGTLRTVEVYYDEGHANQGQSAGSGSSATTSTITVSGLQPGVKYFVKAKVGDEYIGGIEYFTTPEVLTPSGTIDVNYNNKTVKFNVSNLNVGQSVTAFTRIEPSDGKTLWSQSYERTTSNEPHSKSPFATWTGAGYDQEYAASIYLYNNGVIDWNPLAYVTFKFDSPIIQEPGFRIKSYTLTSVTVFVEGLTQNDTVIATVYDANNTSLGTKSESVSSTDGSTKELTISGLNLSPNTQYKVKVSLRAGSAGGAIMTLGEEPFTTSGQINISYTLTDITTNSVTVNISGALPTQNVAVSFYGVDAVYGTVNPNGTVSIVVDNLDVGKKYSGSIRVGDTIINDVIFYTLFEWWLSHPVQGNTMGMYNNSPAPVKAEEWNRLVVLVNSKLSKNINTVTAGDEMNAGSGGNIKVVASALGVSVASKDEVTASFFNALKTAINNI